MKDRNELASLVKSLIVYTDETEWIQFKENWFDVNVLGEYISALSNSAVIQDKDFAYFVWGVNDKTHEIVGTNINYYSNFKNEQIQHYLARHLQPSVNFEFYEVLIEKKRVVVLIISKASVIPTSFENIRYIRIGSSKTKLSKYPEREAYLFECLKGPIQLVDIESRRQDLTFNTLKLYYNNAELHLDDETFYSNLRLLTKDGKYNKMAYLLADKNEISIKVALFGGKDKSLLLQRHEYGNTCLLESMRKVESYLDALNETEQQTEQQTMQEKIIHFLKQNPNAKIIEIAEKFGLSRGGKFSYLFT